MMLAQIICPFGSCRYKRDQLSFSPSLVYRTSLTSIAPPGNFTVKYLAEVRLLPAGGLLKVSLARPDRSVTLASVLPGTMREIVVRPAGVKARAARIAATGQFPIAGACMTCAKAGAPTKRGQVTT